MSQVVCNGTDKKMAESKSSMLAKSVSKHAGRAKEKLLQNLGKVDRTEDEIFDDHLQNFTKQQNNANRLQKEFNNYIRCIRAVQAASKTLMDCLNEMYESGWLGHELLYTQSQNIEMLWNDFSHKLADQVLIPLNTYQAQFPEMRKKIEKRGRKLVDFDSQRHHAQSLQASTNSSKKKDEVKMAKVREQLEEAKRTYEMLNSELHDELPALYDSRVLFLVTNLQTYFAAEQIFHSESSKVFGELEAIVDRLATDCQRSSYAVRKPYSPKPIMNHANNKLTSPSSSHGSVNDENTSCSDTAAVNSEPEKENDIVEKASSLVNGSLDSAATVAEDDVKDISELTPSVQNDTVAESDKEVPKLTNAATAAPTSVTVVISSSNDVKKSVAETAVITNGGMNDNLPPGVLYKVRATYKYTQEDVDELSFEVGEIIRVVEYDDPEEQEEGWLMGIKESTGEKGMFPANFTRPL